ncbi:DUF2510 domain-containing protein [Arthrobacter sp. UYCo732]|uniref:DUF2510 domain-containing protein n=1 Tax=Arthrobacter sp. UYCo732 TaxID=3156336 RepID=UPI0033975333
MSQVTKSGGWKNDPVDARFARYWDGDWTDDRVTYLELSAATDHLGRIPGPEYFKRNELVSPTPTEEGWYPDASDSTKRRYWDGAWGKESYPLAFLLMVGGVDQSEGAGIVPAARFVPHRENPDEIVWFDGTRTTGFYGTPANILANLDWAFRKRGLAVPERDRVERLTDPSSVELDVINEYVVAADQESERQRLEAAARARAARPVIREPEDSARPVSNHGLPDEPTSKGWIQDPNNPECVIYWNTAMWSKRMRSRDMVIHLLNELDEDLPEAWDLKAASNTRVLELFSNTSARSWGEAGWYIDPQHSLGDRRVRYWDGRWTEHVAADAEGWYDDPIDHGNIRYWHGDGWTEHVKNKSFEQLQLDAKEAARYARNQAGKKLGRELLGIALGGATPSERSANKNAAAAQRQRESDKWYADRSRDRADAARKEQEKFYRKRNGW